MPALIRRLDLAKSHVLGLFRIIVGLLFASHGAASLFGIFGGAPGGGAVPVGVWPYWYGGMIQFVGGLLVAAGAITRTAAFIASGSMAYAYFVVHQPTGPLPLQNDGELAAMFCWSFLLLVFTGPGAFALDRLLTARRSTGESAVLALPESPHGRSLNVPS